MPPEITRIECVEFTYPLEDFGERSDSFYPGYDPGSTYDRKALGVRVETDTDHEGRFVALNSTAGPTFDQVGIIAPYLIGKNPLERENHWNQFRMKLRIFDQLAIGPVDVALWDFAGRYFDVPIHNILGTYRSSIPAYASTTFGDDNGGLDSPEAYADFAEACLEAGYRGFKIHGFQAEHGHLDVDREVEVIRAVGERVGDEMDLMYDATGQLETFADVLKAGRACDEFDYFWFEDPGRDVGTSQHGSRAVTDLIDTPLLQTEHVQGLEQKADFAANGATHFLRADPEYDAGITGTMKTARVAEGLGLDVELHICGPAQRQCLAAIRNTNYYELGLVHPDHPPTHDPEFVNDYSDGFDVVDDDGTVAIPDDPGLGVDYDWDYVEANAIRSSSYD